MSVKITLEYTTMDEAIVALGRLVGPVTVATPIKVPLVAGTPPVATTEKKTRKGRSDAGKPRGPHKEADAAGSAGGTPVMGGQSIPAANAQAAPGTSTGANGGRDPATPPAPASAALNTAAPAPAEGDKPQPSGVVPAAAVPVPTPEDVQKAVEKLFNEKGFEDCMLVLSRFGVRRAKELPAESRAEFVAKALAVAAGTERP